MWRVPVVPKQIGLTVMRVVRWTCKTSAAADIHLVLLMKTMVRFIVMVNLGAVRHVRVRRGIRERVLGPIIVRVINRVLRRVHKIMCRNVMGICLVAYILIVVRILRIFKARRVQGDSIMVPVRVPPAQQTVFVIVQWM